MPYLTARQRLGQRLKEHRRAAKISGHDMADTIGSSQASISRIEAGQQRIAAGDVRTWLTAAHAPDDVVDELVDLAERVEVEIARWRDLKGRGWEAHQRAYQDLEDQATRIRIYQPNLIPGLLQSFGYANHLLRHVVDLDTDDDPETAVNARLRRQELLFRPGTHLDVIVAEHVLRQPLGGHAVMAEQLRHLAARAHLPTVDLGVIPTDTDMDETWGHSYVMCEMPDDAESVVLIETVAREVRDGGPEALARYRRQHEVYRAAALSGDDAIRLVERIAEEHTRRAFEGDDQ